MCIVITLHIVFFKSEILPQQYLMFYKSFDKLAVDYPALMILIPYFENLKHSPLVVNRISSVFIYHRIKKTSSCGITKPETCD
jgi:hypothetical protein